MPHTYGIVNKDGIHIDVSSSEKGAKQYATLNGYTKVSVRFNGSCNVYVIALKVANRWIKADMRVSI